MPVQPTRPSRTSRPERVTRQQPIYQQAQPGPDSTRKVVMVILLAMGLVVSCVAGFVLVRVLLSGSPDALSALVRQTPGTPATRPGSQPATPGDGSNSNKVTIDPPQGTSGTLVTVRGWGWWPGEPVFVFLRSPEEEDGPGYAYAAAVADDAGHFETAFTFPDELRWLGIEWANVVATGSRSGLEDSTRFTLVAPTPTNTLPPPTIPPTTQITNTPLPTDTPLPTPTPTSTPQVITDWRGEYFANMALAGEPVFIRNDSAIDFLWGTAAPDEGMPADNFSVRWTRELRFSEGSYRFTLAADDGVRFWMDGQLLVDDWQDGPLRPHALDLALSEGGHTLHLEYYENLGDAGIQLGWKKNEAPTATPTSEPTDTPTPTSTTFPPLPDTWQAQYYANPLLSGDPVLVREEEEINFDWGDGSPGEGIPPDSFSARWTRDLWMPTATYRFLLEVDDGARLWADGQLYIDAWHIATGDTYTVDIDLVEGVHTLEVEYFEAFLDARIHLWVEKVSE